MMTYQDALDYINTSCSAGSKLGLSRMENILERLKNPHKNLKCIHIAGTNGKGSSSAFISAILIQAGYKTGSFTSPHLFSVNERIQIDGKNISNEDLIREVEKIAEIIPMMPEAPTEFELYTAMALNYFNSCRCDIAVLEVGLGGRLDSTNIISSPLLSLITTIGMDHMAELGNTKDRIAREKAGIIKEGCPVLIDGRNTDTLDIFSEVCKEKNAPMYTSEPATIRNLSYSLAGITFDYKELKNIYIPLSASYQPGNAILAIESATLLRKKGFIISDEDIVRGLKNTKWQGRFEIISLSPLFIIDGSHNADGMRETAKTLQLYFPDKKIKFILGMLKDKDVKSSLSYIKDMAAEYHIISPPSPRAMNPEELALMIKDSFDLNSPLFLCTYSSIKEAVLSVLSAAQKEDIIVALGSLYSISELKNSVSAFKK